MSDQISQREDAKLRPWIWGLPTILTLVLIDQLSKAAIFTNPAFDPMACLATSKLECGQIVVVPPLLTPDPGFSLHLIWNRGVSFGALQADGIARWVLFILTAGIALGFLAWLFLTRSRITALALTLVVGGAVGNLIDRARFGAVMDFLDFRGLYFPWIFNVADSAITIGAIILLLDQLLVGRRRPGYRDKAQADGESG